MTTWQDEINRNIVYPSSIRGLANGKFPVSALSDIHDHTGAVIGQMCHEAARAWDAMVAAAFADGITLEVNSSYRTFQRQQELFSQRYVTTNQGNGSSNCGGRTWYLRKGQATAACPGNSNHGLGLSPDITNADRPGPVLNWLIANAPHFGFYWEIPSESWHLHYLTGDQIPQAVLDHEAQNIPKYAYEGGDVIYILEPSGRIWLLHDGKLVYVTGPSDLTDKIPQWKVDAPMWANLTKAYPMFS